MTAIATPLPAPAYPCAISPQEDAALSSGFRIVDCGTNPQGNDWFRIMGPHGESAYMYHNRDGSYYYKSPCGTGFFLARDGFQQYTTLNGTRYILWLDGTGRVFAEERPLRRYVSESQVQAEESQPAMVKLEVEEPQVPAVKTEEAVKTEF